MTGRSRPRNPGAGVTPTRPDPDTGRRTARPNGSIILVADGRKRPIARVRAARMHPISGRSPPPPTHGIVGTSRPLRC